MLSDIESESIFQIIRWKTWHTIAFNQGQAMQVIGEYTRPYRGM